MDFNEEPAVPLLTKTEAAAALRCHASRLSHYIRDRKIHGNAIVGTGRHARIDIDVARRQLRNAIDIGQRTGLGNATHLQLTPEKSKPAPVSQLSTALLLEILHEAPALAAWSAAEHGASLQQTFDIYSDGVLNIVGMTKTAYGVTIPGPFETIAWADLAEEYGLPPQTEQELAAERARRRAAED